MDMSAKEEMEASGARQRQRPHRVSKIEVSNPQSMSMGKDLLIIELRKTSKSENYLKEGSTVSQAQVSYWGRRPEGIVLGRVRIEGKGTGRWMGKGCIQSVSESGMRRYTYEHCGAINGISMQIDRNRLQRKEGWNPKSQDCWPRWPADEAGW